MGGITVNDGKFNVEALFSYENYNADDIIRFRQHFDYGFSNYYALRLITTQIDGESADFEEGATTIENRFQLFNKPSDGFEGGFRLTYTKRPSKSDIAEIFTTAEIDWNDQWLTRHNIVMSHELGAGRSSGLNLSVRNRLGHRFNPEENPLRINQAGIDLYHTVGNIRINDKYSDQTHQLAAYFNQEFEENIYTQLTYRYGISAQSSDHATMFTIGRNF